MRKTLAIPGVFGAAAFWLAVTLGSNNPAPRQAQPEVAFRTDPRLVHRPGSQPVTVLKEDGRLHDVLEKVAAQANVRLWLSPGAGNPPVSYSAVRVPVRKVLSDLCEGDRCRWKIETTIVVWDRREPTPEWSLGVKPCRP